jgi:hypothetical protein
MPVLSFKVSAADARAIRARARASKKTLSAYLREQALRKRKPRKALVLKTHPASGLTYDATRGPAVTDEEIRAVLADFP